MKGMRSRPKMAAMLAGATMATACVQMEDEVPDIADRTPSPGVACLRLREITIVNEADGSALEIEVQLFDEAPGTLLGCAGAIQGLLSVDEVGIRYQGDAHFMPPGSPFRYPTGLVEWLTAQSGAGQDDHAQGGRGR